VKLVHDADNLVSLDVYNFQDIAGCARRFAEQLEAGSQGDVTRVIAVIETPEGITLGMWGDETNGYELVGILEAAKLHAYDANVSDD